jgi:hypothetical protein
METKQVEQNILIATRISGEGDTWILVGEEIKHSSLTDVLEAYFQKTGNKCHFRLEPLNSKLFAISIIEELIMKEPPKRYNIYGDPE